MQFADWLIRDRASFDDAYIALCIPKILAPLIRLELIAWNPLEQTPPPLSSYQWFVSSLKFGADRGLDESVDAVTALIPELMEKVVCPRLTGTLIEMGESLKWRERESEWMFRHSGSGLGSVVPIPNTATGDVSEDNDYIISFHPRRQSTDTTSAGSHPTKVQTDP